MFYRSFHRLDTEKTEVTLMCDQLADEVDDVKRNLVSTDKI